MEDSDNSVDEQKLRLLCLYRKLLTALTWNRNEITTSMVLPTFQPRYNRKKLLTSTVKSWWNKKVITAQAADDPGAFTSERPQICIVEDYNASIPDVDGSEIVTGVETFADTANKLFEGCVPPAFREHVLPSLDEAYAVAGPGSSVGRAKEVPLTQPRIVVRHVHRSGRSVAGARYEDA